MNKPVVVYKSEYGTTKQYAKWISEEVQGDLFEVSKISITDVEKYDTLIYGGGLYAGGILGFKFIKNNFEALKNKKIILFTVGLADPLNKEQFNGIINSSLSEEMKEKINVFHFRGGINYKKLGIVHKGMMLLMKNSVAKKKPSEMTPDDKSMLETYGKEIYFTDRQTIAPIVDFVNNK